MISRNLQECGCTQPSARTLSSVRGAYGELRRLLEENSFALRHPGCSGEFEQTARNPGNANANVTFYSLNKPKVTFAFAFPGLRAVCSNSPLTPRCNHHVRRAQPQRAHSRIRSPAGSVLPGAGPRNGRCRRSGSVASRGGHCEHGKPLRGEGRIKVPYGATEMRADCEKTTRG